MQPSEGNAGWLCACVCMPCAMSKHSASPCANAQDADRGNRSRAPKQRRECCMDGQIRVEGRGEECCRTNQEAGWKLFDLHLLYNLIVSNAA